MELKVTMLVYGIEDIYTITIKTLYNSFSIKTGNNNGYEIIYYDNYFPDHGANLLLKRVYLTMLLNNSEMTEEIFINLQNFIRENWTECQDTIINYYVYFPFFKFKNEMKEYEKEFVLKKIIL